MSRFEGDYDEEPFPNAYWLWENSLKRAMSSKRGQQALRDLEAALLELPEPKLISEALAAEGQVCAVGAYALKKGMEKGKTREEVLAELERRIPQGCDNCWHAADSHGPEGCNGMSRSGDATQRCGCQELVRVPNWNGDGSIETVDVGVECGLAQTLAWAIGGENDLSFREDETPEQRYGRLLAWTRARIVQEERGAEEFSRL